MLLSHNHTLSKSHDGVLCCSMDFIAAVPFIITVTVQGCELVIPVLAGSFNTLVRGLIIHWFCEIRFPHVKGSTLNYRNSFSLSFL